jgi:osmotically-inducible protein OsmY
MDFLGRHVGDAKITASVEAAFKLNADLSRCDTDVETEEGVVTLRGVVPQEALKRRAVEIAGAVPDVRQVVDHLRVSATARAEPGDERSLGETIDDRAVELRVRAALALDRTLEGTALDVAVFRREVVLSGEVPEAGQAERALRIARQTAGVESVVDRLRERGGEAPAAERVRRALAENSHLAGYRLEVEDRDGRLTLSGRVSTGAERELAGLLAETTADRPVDNRVTVRP